MTQAKDLAGAQFGLWRIHGRAGSRDGKALWQARCACGTERQLTSSQLGAGRSQSCGCRRAEITRATHTSHGQSKSLTYFVWSSMVQRTTNPANKSWPRYGGRGVTLDPAWRSFDAFFADMGEAPTGMQIEREKNHLGYSKENCYWATPSQNMRNTRQTVMVDYQGRSMPLIEASELSGINYSLLRSRRKRGLTGSALYSKERSTYTRKTP